MNDPVTATDLAAVASVASPLWLHSVSDGATIALPILGCAWLLLQMFFKFSPLFIKLFRKK